LNINNVVVTEWVNLFCRISTGFEKKEFSKIKFAVDAEHKKYIKIPSWFGLKNNIRMFLFRTKNSLKINKNKFEKILKKVKNKIRVLK